MPLQYLTNDSIDGFPLYDSIFETICCDKPVLFAMSFCVSFFSFRIFFKHFAILYISFSVSYCFWSNGSVITSSFNFLLPNKLCNDYHTKMSKYNLFLIINITSFLFYLTRNYINILGLCLRDIIPQTLVVILNRFLMNIRIF